MKPEFYNKNKILLFILKIINNEVRRKKGIKVEKTMETVKLKSKEHHNVNKRGVVQASWAGK